MRIKDKEIIQKFALSLMPAKDDLNGWQRYADTARKRGNSSLADRIEKWIQKQKRKEEKL